jgi:tight adherence protein B
MTDIALPILTASSVGMGVWAIFRIAPGVMRRDERKIKSRLSGGGSEGVAHGDVAKTIRRRTGLDDVQGLLGEFEVFHHVNRMLLQSAPKVTLQKFLTYVACAGAAGMFLVFLITTAVIVSLVAAVLGGAVPFLYLINKRNKRQRLLVDQLPDALDFMGRALRAGHSMPTAFQMMSDELPEPIGGEFRRVFEQHSLGASLDDCLRAAAGRVESTDFAFFVTSALIQRQTGGDMSEVLNNITGMIRARVRLQQHVKSKTAEGRFTGYILAAFPAVMFVLSYCLNKEYAGKLLEDSTGMLMLGGALGLQLLGLFVIRKITTVSV